MTINTALADELIEAFHYFKEKAWGERTVPSDIKTRTAINLTYDYACLRAASVQPIPKEPEPERVLEPPTQYVPLKQRGGH
ncbi:MAG: hypothetical protein A4E30_00309 [Methanomassiliicoccales archaeon PtaB.Bin215]|nr:MAG: hypothetical protein A4E30_00309 [Methanomassiliicoccales archaeon PtaB.Bin215]